MVRERVTNAIRYGRAPVQLRLILQSTLTCEVSDASSTAPHLRCARIYDVGVRGLLLVAQCAERWVRDTVARERSSGPSRPSPHTARRPPK